MLTTRATKNPVHPSRDQASSTKNMKINTNNPFGSSCIERASNPKNYSKSNTSTVRIESTTNVLFIPSSNRINGTSPIAILPFLNESIYGSSTKSRRWFVRRKMRWIRTWRSVLLPLKLIKILERHNKILHSEMIRG